MNEQEFLNKVTTYCCNANFNFAQHENRCKICEKQLENLKKALSLRIESLRYPLTQTTPAEKLIQENQLEPKEKEA